MMPFKYGLIIALLVGMGSAQPSFADYRYEIEPYFKGSGLGYRWPIFTFDREPEFGLFRFIERGRRPIQAPVVPKRSQPVREVVYIYPPAHSAANLNQAFTQPGFTPYNRPLSQQAMQQLWGQNNAQPPRQTARNQATNENFTHLLAKAAEQFREEDYAAAQSTYQAVRETIAGNAMVEMGYALAVMAEGNYTTAAQSLRRALRLHPSWYTDPVRLQSFYGDLEKFTPHWQALTEALEEEPNHQAKLFLVSYFAYLQGDYEQAQEWLTRLLEQAPKDVEASTILGQVITQQAKSEGN